MMSSAPQPLIQDTKQQLSHTPILAEPATEVMRLEIKVTPPEEIKEKKEKKSEEKTSDLAPEIKRSDLHGAQTDMYMAQLLEPEKTTYTHTAAMEIHDPEKKLNIEIFFRAMVFIINRHEALRSIFIEENQQIQQVTLPMQLIKPNASWPLKIIDGSRFQKDIPPVNQLTQTLNKLDEKKLLERPFFPSTEPLWRLVLVQFSKQRWQLLLIAHHLVFDIAAQNIFFKELSIVYNTLASSKSEKEIPLPPPVSLSDIHTPAVTSEQIESLTRSLKNYTPLALEPDHEYRNFRSKGERIFFKIDKALVNSLKETFVKKNGPTLYSTLLAGIYTLFYRYTGQTDIALFTASANRRDEKSQSVLNSMVNTVPLREMFNSSISFNDFLLQVANHLKEALENQIPLHYLAQTNADNIMVVFNQPKQGLMLKGITTTRPIELDLKNAKFKLAISFDLVEDGIEYLLEINKDYYKPETFHFFHEHLTALLKDAVKYPQKKLSQLNMLATEEKQFLSRFHQQKKPSLPKFAFELLQECAAKHPTKKAIVFHHTDGSAETISYRALDQECKKIAGFLQKKGCGVKRRVGISVTRNMNLPIATFAVMYAGATSVALETEISGPLKHKLADAQLAAILTDSQTTTLFQEFENPPRTFDISDKASLSRVIRTEHAAYVRPALTPESLINIEYTSGSTGKPKGVSITQRGIANLINVLREEKLSPDDKVLSISPRTFDAFHFDWILAFTHGAEVHYLEKYSPEEITNVILKNKITVITLAAKVLKLLGNPEDFPSLRYVITMGATQDEETVKLWQEAMTKRRGKFINGYGPTENTVATTLHPYAPDDHHRTIGKPFPGVEIAIINTEDHQNEVPVGQAGEIWISGNQLAEGYFHNTKLTAETFPQCSYNRVDCRMEFLKKATEEKKSSPEKKPTRWYRTGDMGYIEGTHGNLVYLARTDAQVKISDARIELDGMSAELMKHSDLIKEAVVLPTEDKEHLIAYIVPQDPKAIISIVDINQRLDASALPDAARVSQVGILPFMPLTENGKVNTALLKTLEIKIALPEKTTRPLTETESRLKKVCISIFKLNQDFDLDDHFKDLGVKSRQMAYLEIAINHEFKPAARFKIITLDNADFTLKKMAAILEKLPKKIASSKGTPGLFAPASEQYPGSDDLVVNQQWKLTKNSI